MHFILILLRVILIRFRGAYYLNMRISDDLAQCRIFRGIIGRNFKIDNSHPRKTYEDIFQIVRSIEIHFVDVL